MRSRAVRLAYLAGGVVLTGLGAAGLILPVMPGTVFLILAGACFARSSPAFEAWLLAHPWLGPGVRAWRETGAIAFRIKALAITVMAGSLALVWFSGAPLFAKWLVTAIMIPCALFVGSRPGTPSARGKDAGRNDNEKKDGAA